MTSYKDLDVWRVAIELTKEIYRITAQFPKAELFGLVAQMRRAAISIVSNIAEGFARRTRKENAQFVSIAYGSAAELETQVIVAKSLGFVPESEWHRTEELLNRVLRMLNRLRDRLAHPNGEERMAKNE